MRFHIAGHTETLDADYATDTGASYSWDGPVPHCEGCHDPLVVGRHGSAHIQQGHPDTAAILACDCGREYVQVIR